MPRVLSAALFVGALLCPGLALAQAGQEVTLTGLLEVLHGEDFAGAHDVIYRVEELQSQRLPGQARRAFQLAFDPGKAPSNVQTGARVRVRGRTNASGELEVFAASGGNLQVVDPAVTAAATGEQRCIVFLMHFQDKLLSSSATQQAVAGIMFDNPDSINALYQEASHGAVGFAGDVVGPFTVPFDSSSSDYVGWARSAEQQAAAAGVDLSNYTRRIFVSPTNGTGYAGVGNLGGSVTRAWTFYWNNRLVYAHELGHNLGMGHASTPGSEYGDRSCVMGIATGSLYHFNAAHKAGTGWIPATAANGGGVYTLTANAAVTTMPQVLRVPVDSGPDVWVSYRNTAGFDGGLSSSYTFKTSVHTFTGSGSAKTYLQAALADGQSWSHPSSGITVTQLSNDGLSATVNVTVVATPATPTVTASPQAGAGQAGATTTYTVSLTNRDSSSSPDSTFALATTGPADWTVSISPASLTLAPGQTASAQVSVISLATDADTNVSIGVNISDQEPLHNVSTSITHHVDSTAPTVPGALTASAGRRSVSLSWDASNDANAALGLSYVLYRDGVEIGTLTQRSTTDSPGSGTFTYEVLARDAAGNTSGRSAPATVTLAAKGKGGGGGGNGGGKGNGKKK
jgi:hypothetical protein